MPRKIMRDHAKLRKTMRNHLKPRKTTRNYAKLRKTMQNHATMPKHACPSTHAQARMPKRAQASPSTYVQPHTRALYYKRSAI